MKLRRLKEIAILALVAATVAVASLRDTPRTYSPLTFKLTQATSHELIDKVAKELKLKVVGCPPEPAESRPYRQDYEFVDAPVEEVLNSAYGEWKLLDDVLVVTPACVSEFYPDGCRMEYLLEEASADILVSFLRRAFSRVKLTPHPTMNGFYALGNKDDLLEIKKLLVELDHNPIPLLPDRYRRHSVQWLKPKELETALKSRFPQLAIQVNSNELLLDGPLPEVDEALLYAQELDRKIIEVRVSLEDLGMAPPTCELLRDPPETVNCEPTCQGPLHLLGLKPGDILPDFYNKPLRTTPEWLVERNGKNYRILLDLQK